MRKFSIRPISVLGLPLSIALWVTFAQPLSADEANDLQRADTPRWFSCGAATALVATASEPEQIATAKSFVGILISEQAKDGPASPETKWGLAKRQKAIFSLLANLPLYRSNEGIDTAFGQGRLAYRPGGRMAGNLGVGYHRLASEGRAMPGAKAFFNYDRHYSHARSGFGAQVRSGPIDLNSSLYHALAGRFQITSTTHERVLDGYGVDRSLALRIQAERPFEIEAGVQGGNVANSAYLVFRVRLTLGRPAL